MGRYNFRAARVAQHANDLLKIGHISNAPSWLEPMTQFPPPQALVRPQPIQHIRHSPRRKSKKASRMFKPQPLSYEEDRLREQFFSDHPWELARPRTMVEGDGKDFQRNDWQESSQPGRALDGESMVQRQMVLMGEGMSRTKAFDQARKEFYRLRHDAEVAARVQREEALATGAYYGMSSMEVGMQLENKTFNEFRAWAKQQVIIAEQSRNSAYTGVGAVSSEEMDVDSSSLGNAADDAGSNDEQGRSI